MSNDDPDFTAIQAHPSVGMAGGSTRCVDPPASPTASACTSPITSAVTLSHLGAELAGAVLMPETPPPDKRLTGERQSFEALHWLHRFGWLTSRMVAALD